MDLRFMHPPSIGSATVEDLNLLDSTRMLVLPLHLTVLGAKAFHEKLYGSFPSSNCFCINSLILFAISAFMPAGISANFAILSANFCHPAIILLPYQLYSSTPVTLSL